MGISPPISTPIDTAIVTRSDFRHDQAINGGEQLDPQ
jgi:hypothetical protein